ncbi:MAG TPA: hypothetical protein VLB76_09650 [Thermoanaerobaculia bacterium]|jgi:hypothetical protein|nr:hypothetical protein [Thermoanaerobaculia bacterium]
MPFNLELTISGLCVIVLKSPNDRPPTPTAVDIVCIAAYGHRSRLSYPPEFVSADGEVEPELCVDSTGQRIAVLDIRDRVLSLQARPNAAEFSLEWGDTTKKTPPYDVDERWMQWIPSIADLGLTGIRLKEDDAHEHLHHIHGKRRHSRKASRNTAQKYSQGVQDDNILLARGMSSRMSLPPGRLFARNILKDEDDEYFVWGFPGSGAQRALANEIVYRAEGLEQLLVSWDDKQLSYDRESDLYLCVSNDMEIVPSSYSDGDTELHHMAFLENLADPLMPVQIPKVVDTRRTGRPICNQVYFVDKT